MCASVLELSMQTYLQAGMAAGAHQPDRLVNRPLTGGGYALSVRVLHPRAECAGRFVSRLVMRSAISFLSLLAFGFLAAGILTVIGSDPEAGTGLGRFSLGMDQGGIHLGSLLLGLVLGFLLSALARVSWTELPRRFVGWLLQYERSFYRLTLAAILIGVLVFY